MISPAPRRRAWAGRSRVASSPFPGVGGSGERWSCTHTLARQAGLPRLPLQNRENQLSLIPVTGSSKKMGKAGKAFALDGVGNAPLQDGHHSGHLGLPDPAGSRLDSDTFLCSGLSLDKYLWHLRGDGVPQAGGRWTSSEVPWASPFPPNMLR